jgi:effector-binding domain-containing protein
MIPPDNSFYIKWMCKYFKQKLMKQKIKNSLMLLITLATVTIAKAQEVSRITMQPINIVYVVDTATTVESFSPKMEKGFNRLFTLIGQQQLKPGRVMAIYHTITPPWVFDIAVEVDKEPAQLKDAVQFKTIAGGDAVTVHYKGPYEQIEKAYLQIEEWLKKNNKQKAGPPIEIYLNDPATVKDKNELLTDVYQLIK